MNYIYPYYSVLKQTLGQGFQRALYPEMSNYIFRILNDPMQPESEILSLLAKAGVRIDTDFGVVKADLEGNKFLLRGEATAAVVQSLNLGFPIEVFSDPSISIEPQNQEET